MENYAYNEIIAEYRLIDSAFVVLTAPGLVFRSENFIRCMLYPLGNTVPKLSKTRIVRLQQGFMVSYIYHITSIPINIENPRFHIFMPFVHNL